MQSIAYYFLCGLMAISYTRSYTVSCLQLIISFYSSCTAYIFKYIYRAIIDHNRSKRLKRSFYIAYEKNRYVQNKKKWKKETKTTEFILDSNKSRATINGSTLSIGYIHREIQYTEWFRNICANFRSEFSTHKQEKKCHIHICPEMPDLWIIIERLHSI